MKWKDRRRSSNVNRGSKAPVVFGGGIGGLILMLVFYFLGADPGTINSNTYENGQSQYEESVALSDEDKELEDFLSVVLADTEDMWNETFNSYNLNYNEPSMTLYQDTTKSSCGIAQAGMGPFYCPMDEAIYIDVSFYNELKETFGAGGDFDFAYVLAHEVGHHIQNELGILSQVNSLRTELSEVEYNKYSVAQEIQADYFAGVYAYYSKDKGYLEKGDIEEAMTAAKSIGDDKIQEMSGMKVNPDSFTHGSSRDRKDAFMLGLKYHDIENSMIFYENLAYAPSLAN